MVKRLIITATLAFALAIAAPALAAPSSILRGPVHGTLRGMNHHPKVGKNWTYTVTATDANGRKLSGTETTEYVYGGEVVGHENPTNVHFRNGYYRDTIQFPATAVGYPLSVRVVIHTNRGSITLDWAVTVQQ